MSDAVLLPPLLKSAWKNAKILNLHRKELTRACQLIVTHKNTNTEIGVC